MGRYLPGAALPCLRSPACVAVAGTIAYQKFVSLQSQAGGELHVPARAHPRQVWQPAWAEATTGAVI